MAEIEVVGPMKGGWYAIVESGILSEARFPDESSGWLAWREYNLGKVSGGVKPVKRMF